MGGAGQGLVAVSMATQMFEGRGHAAVYQKYRFSPGEELRGAILGYLREKVSRAQPKCGVSGGYFCFTGGRCIAWGCGEESARRGCPLSLSTGCSMGVHRAWNGVKSTGFGGIGLRCACFPASQGTKPTELAVDVGCGSGQGTRFLAERFGKVVGTDISQAQIQEAKAAPSPPNVSYL